jgi:nitroimidazol reductase NimA-like FMN-containing flavoprotein (pyridoxamine 5'-phosphate oxidase superfamily)
MLTPTIGIETIPEVCGLPKAAADLLLLARATSSSKEPCVVPLNFVYYDGRIFFHCAKEGKKLDNIKNNQKVCFEVDELTGIKDAEKSCDFGAYYRSVIVFGETRIIDNIDLERQVLARA